MWADERKKKAPRGAVTAASRRTPSCGMTGMIGVDACARQSFERARHGDTPRTTGCAMLHQACGCMPAWLDGGPAGSRVTRARVIAPRSLSVCLWRTRGATPRKLRVWVCLSVTTSRFGWRRCMTLTRPRIFCRAKTSNYRLGPDWAQTCEKRPVCLAAVGRLSTSGTARRNFDLGSGPGGLRRIRFSVAALMVAREPGIASSTLRAWREAAGSPTLPTLEATSGGARG